MYIHFFFQIQEPTETVLAAFAQVQSLTEALNEYITVTNRQEMSPISSSLCDDCHKTRKCQTLFRSSSNSSTVTTVVRNIGPSSDQTSLIQDDDGYCEIDEIRMPSIQPSAKSVQSTKSNSTSDPKSPTETSDDGDPSDATERLTNAQSTATNAKNNEESNSIGTSENTEELIATIDVASDVDEQSQKLTKLRTAMNKADENVQSVTADSDEHIEINDAYDSISQRMSADSEIASETVHCMSESCQTNHLGTPLMPSIPCHLITTYVSALNSHISLLLVSWLASFLNFQFYSIRCASQAAMKKKEFQS